MGRRVEPLLALELPCDTRAAVALLGRLEGAYRLELLEGLLLAALSAGGLAAVWGLGWAARLLVSAALLAAAHRVVSSLRGLSRLSRLRLLAAAGG
ncbi:MAG: hypothetical protein GXO15_04695, partial [Crenarchaeota archaeon]|nr:hypothetical protein [Thermoproteota archaeon]